MNARPLPKNNISNQAHNRDVACDVCHSFRLVMRFSCREQKTRFLDGYFGVGGLRQITIIPAYFTLKPKVFFERFFSSYVTSLWYIGCAQRIIQRDLCKNYNNMPYGSPDSLFQLWVMIFYRNLHLRVNENYSIYYIQVQYSKRQLQIDVFNSISHKLCTMGLKITWIFSSLEVWVIMIKQYSVV